MAYNVNDIDKILGFKTWTDKQKIDALLKIDCSMYTRLGSDSLRKEIDEVHKSSRKLYQAIKSVNPEEAKILLR
jgi:hypothetical protein|tara:strand:+ start:1833 stop:2054 length:222 start_codon:yes stop_codon:yes gene_type:complete